MRKYYQNYGLSEMQGPRRPSKIRLTLFIDEETGLEDLVVAEDMWDLPSWC